LTTNAEALLALVARILELEPLELSFVEAAPAPVRRVSDWPCPHCEVERFETLVVEDERGRHWDVDRCGCRY
jgi:hypothetical protein